MQDLKRNTKQSMPFAKHTHFHAQMVRVASLHQNILQAFQVSGYLDLVAVEPFNSRSNVRITASKPSMGCRRHFSGQRSVGMQLLQVFHKSVQQTACVRASAGVLHALAHSARAASALARAVPAPRALPAAAAACLYDDVRMQPHPHRR